jgi:hypothetical protein
MPILAIDRCKPSTTDLDICRSVLQANAALTSHKFPAWSRLEESRDFTEEETFLKVYRDELTDTHFVISKAVNWIQGLG